MSFKETDVKEISNPDHEVLGADFCSGYTDIFGKWNTGFDCPRMGNGETVYCCGTVTSKYCCTRREQQTSSGISQSVLIGSALGAVFVIILVTLVSCLICRRCVPYRRCVPHPTLNGGPLYTMHCSSTASGMTNLYSFSGQTTTTTTPLDTPHVLVDFDGPEHHIYAQPMNGHRGISRHLVRAESCGTPSDPPPPYNEQNPRAESVQDRLRGDASQGGFSTIRVRPSSRGDIRQLECVSVAMTKDNDKSPTVLFNVQDDNQSFALQSSSSQQRQSTHPNRRHDPDAPAQNRQYWQTKF